MWFPNRSNTNRAVQVQKMAGNFGFSKSRNCTIHVVKTKVLISFAVTAKLFCPFVFAYAKCWFSHDTAQQLFYMCCTIGNPAFHTCTWKKHNFIKCKFYMRISIRCEKTFELLHGKTNNLHRRKQRRRSASR